MVVVATVIDSEGDDEVTPVNTTVEKDTLADTSANAETDVTGKDEIEDDVVDIGSDEEDMSNDFPEESVWMKLDDGSKFKLTQGAKGVTFIAFVDTGKYVGVLDGDTVRKIQSKDVIKDEKKLLALDGTGRKKYVKAILTHMSSSEATSSSSTLKLSKSKKKSTKKGIIAKTVADFTSKMNE